MMSLRISVVTPSFNQARFLDATMQSVLGQNYPNLEYVVMDGGSTDGLVDLIQKRSSQLHYWASAPDDGPGDAINKGFARTTGEIMAWLNSDDLYHPWTFAVVDEIFQTFPEVEWITGIPAFWDSKGRLINIHREYPLLPSLITLRATIVGYSRNLPSGAEVFGIGRAAD